MALGRRLTIAVDAEGVVSTTSEVSGGLSLVTDAVTTAFDPDVALTGTAKYIQLGMAAAAGNMLAVKALSGDFGLAATRTLTFKFGGKDRM